VDSNSVIKIPRYPGTSSGHYLDSGVTKHCIGRIDRTGPQNRSFRYKKGSSQTWHFWIAVGLEILGLAFWHFFGDFGLEDFRLALMLTYLATLVW